MSRDEFELIQRYFTRPSDDPGIILGIGDDAAIVQPAGPLAITTDTLVAGVHFPENLSAEAIGYRVMAVNLSDLAAMGAQPRWCTLALTMPQADEPWLEAFSKGLFRLAERFSVSLIGGDLTRGPLAATVQLIGPLSPGRRLARGGGHPGDDIYVTGSLGDAAAGLALYKEGAGSAGSEHRALQDRFLWPIPRVAEGRVIGPSASAAIDVSDGLVADLGHLCAASECGASIDVEHVPLSAELLALFPPQAAQAYALAGGDDYELCFTAPPAQAQALEMALESIGSGARRIGQLIEGVGVTCRRGGEPFTPPSAGYKHF